MTICPYDCSLCDDPSCRRDGCGRNNETIHVVCEGCGEPAASLDCLRLCMTCVLALEQMKIPMPRNTR